MKAMLLGLVLVAGTAVAQVRPPAQVPGVTDPAATARPALPVPRDPKLPSLFLVGDSTVRNGRGDGGQGQWGWGEPLVSFFDTTKVNVVNRAIGGRSSKSYISEGEWDKTLAYLKPGDVVLFQWGHNDGGKPDEPTRTRASLPGVGEETVEIDNLILKKHEVVHTYGWYLRKYVEETKAKGATPIICSPIPRKIWRDGKVARNGTDYAGWAKQVANAEQVGFIDLNTLIADRYDQLGEAAVEPLFADPHTHTSAAGAERNAEEVVVGLKRLKVDPLAEDFSEKGAAVKP